MKKLLTLLLLFSLICIPASHASDSAEVKRFHGDGEVTSIDPVYSRITIHHTAIKGFGADSDTEFFAKSPDLLKKISKSDLVSFDIEESKGDAQIVKIEKTGQAPPKEEGVPLGQAAQGMLEGAGKVVTTVTSPIAPVSDAAGGAINSAGTAVSGGAQPRVDDGSVESKTKF